MARKGRLRELPLVSLEAVAAIGAATGTVALLEGVAPVTGLGVVYLLAVLLVASRHGEIAALATAVASVLTLHFFFLGPLQLRSRRGWLYAMPDSAWQREELDRVAEPLARLVDVAIGREEVAEHTAEAEAARRADVAKTAVLHAISHDLRSPLTAITTATAALRSGPLSDEDRRELLSVLGSESSRLARLVDDLLDLSRIEAGAVNPQPDWCDLRDTVASAAEHVRSEHGEHE